MIKFVVILSIVPMLAFSQIKPEPANYNYSKGNGICIFRITYNSCFYWQCSSQVKYLGKTYSQSAYDNAIPDTTKWRYFRFWELSEIGALTDNDYTHINGWSFVLTSSDGIHFTGSFYFPETFGIYEFSNIYSGGTHNLQSFTVDNNLNLYGNGCTGTVDHSNRTLTINVTTNGNAGDKYWKVNFNYKNYRGFTGITEFELPVGHWVWFLKSPSLSNYEKVSIYMPGQANTHIPDDPKNYNYGNSNLNIQ